VLELGLDTVFNPTGIRYLAPSELYEGRKHLRIGAIDVHCHEFGPTHTASDTVVHVPQEGVVFAGDLMFCDCHPVLGFWPIENWVAACDQLLAWDAAIYVPGQGAVSSPSEVIRHRDYITSLYEMSRRRYARGMTVDQAALDIFESTPEFQKLYRGDILRKNVNVVYHQLMQKPIVENFETYGAQRMQFRNKIRGRARGILENHVPDGN
jgi:cyclase